MGKEFYNYYPGGMLMPGRKFTQASSNYHYGFNGKENDNEVKGEGNQQDYGMRIYDTRLVRFLSVDPLAKQYTWNSPFSYAEGDLIRCVDLDGKEKQIYIYDFSADKITKTKINLPTAGPLGNGVLVQSNYGGKIRYFFGNEIPNPSLISFEKAYEGAKIDKDGNHYYYKDKNGHPTIGSRHLIIKGDPYKPGNTISEMQAGTLFISDHKKHNDDADIALSGKILNKNQRNALYDMSFNRPRAAVDFVQDNSRLAGENTFFGYMANGAGVQKRRFGENFLYSEGKYIHFDVIDSKKQKSEYKIASTQVENQTGGPDPITATGNAAKIPNAIK